MLMQFFGFVLISFLVVSVILNEKKMFAYNNMSPLTDLFNPLHSSITAVNKEQRAVHLGCCGCLTVLGMAAFSRGAAAQLFTLWLCLQ